MTASAPPPEIPPPTFEDAVRRHRDGDLDGAEAAYRAILGRDPGHAGATHLLGVAHHQRGRHEAAVELIGRAIAMAPDRATYRNNLGVALKALGRLDEAVVAYREALRLDPDYADALANLGPALHELGRHDEARAYLEAALGADPGHVDALYNLGNLLLATGHAEPAVALYRRAAGLAPRRADIPNNLGNALLDRDRPDEAIAAYRHALALDPAHAEAWANLGTALAGQGRVEEAGEAHAAAARLRPHEAHWPIRIAALCPAVFPSRDAIDRYRIGLEAVLDAHRGGVPLAPEAAATSGCCPPFNLAHHGRGDRRIKEKFAALFRDAPAGLPRPAPAPDPGGGPARVGFLVTHPHQGGFLRFAGGIVERLDPGRFAPVVLGSARAMPALRAAIRRPDAEFVPLPDDLPGAVARALAARCAALYHWQVGTDPLNYFLALARLAPVQCTSWGTHDTSGIPAVDHYLSSELIEAPGAEAHYTEALVRMATLPTYQRPIPRPDPPPRRAEFGLPEGRHLYACLQRLPKFHPDFDALLAAVLRRDPAGLVLIPEDRSAHATGQLRARLGAAMPDVADRVAFLPRRDYASYLRLLALADVALDVPQYSAGHTGFEILGLGVPLVTLPGAFKVGRYALAYYRKLGLTELVADSPARYVELAVRLGADRGYRADVAGRIAAASPGLFEDSEAVAEHERFFERAVAASRS